jgi:hypothetical protein
LDYFFSTSNLDLAFEPNFRSTKGTDMTEPEKPKQRVAGVSDAEADLANSGAAVWTNKFFVGTKRTGVLSDCCCNVDPRCNRIKESSHQHTEGARAAIRGCYAGSASPTRAPISWLSHQQRRALVAVAASILLTEEVLAVECRQLAVNPYGDTAR